MHLTDLALEQTAADREVLDEALDAEDLVPLRATLVDLLGSISLYETPPRRQPTWSPRLAHTGSSA